MTSSDADAVTYAKNNRVAVITLNRPQTRNAIDPAMDQRLRKIWADFRDDDGLDVAIWTGTGNSFCAGADRNTGSHNGSTPMRLQCEITRAGSGSAV